MFPYKDDNPTELTPYITVAVIALNVLAWVVLQGMGAPALLAHSVCRLGLIPGELLRTVPPHTVVPLGPGLACTTTAHPAYATVFTSMFMHGGWFHLIGNMWFLWIFGDNIEQDLGRVRYTVFYLLCGILASLTHVAMNASGPSAQIPSLGASGAISGVMGAYLVLHPYRRVTVLLMRIVTEVPGFVAVGLWFLFQLVSGLQVFGGASSGVAYGAHIGGFIAGAALVKLFQIGRPPPSPLRQSYRQARAPWV